MQTTLSYRTLGVVALVIAVMALAGWWGSTLTTISAQARIHR